MIKSFHDFTRVPFSSRACEPRSQEISDLVGHFKYIIEKTASKPGGGDLVQKVVPNNGEGN